MIDGDGNVKEKFDDYSNISKSYSKDTLGENELESTSELETETSSIPDFDDYSNILKAYNKDALLDNDVGSTSTLVTETNNIPDNVSIAETDKTAVNKIKILSLLPGELGITNEELGKLSYSELIVIREAINREYDARAEEFESDLIASIRTELSKLTEDKRSKSVVVDREDMGGNITMDITQKDVLRGQKRVALVEIARLWEMIQEQRKIRERKREQLLDECNIRVDEKSIEDDIDEDKDSDILKRAIINVSKTAKLDDSEVNEELYKDFTKKDMQRNEMEQDEFYDALQYDIQKDLKKRIMALRDQVNEEIESLNNYQHLLEDKIRELQEKEDSTFARELYEDYTELGAYINIYNEQQKEIDNILTTYNECERTGILFVQDEMLNDKTIHAMDEQIDQMLSLIDSTRLNITKRVVDIADKMKSEEVKKDKDVLDISLKKEILWVVNLLGKGLLANDKYNNELRMLTTEERFLIKELEISAEEIKIKNFEDTSWSKELFTTADILYQAVRNKVDNELRDKVKAYKINNESTLDAVKEKIDGTNKREYSSVEYENAHRIVAKNLGKLARHKYELEMDSLTIKDCQVLAQMIDEEYIKMQEEGVKEIKNTLVTKLKNGVKDPLMEIENAYSEIKKSLKHVYEQRSIVRDAFNLVISQKEEKIQKGVEKSLDVSVPVDRDSQSVLINSGIVDVKLYSDYVARYKKEQVATYKDIGYILNKVRNAAVSGGYYYIMLDNEKNDLVTNIGEPVISNKGITVFKIDENRLSFDKRSGKFFETIFTEDSSDFSKIALNTHTYWEPFNKRLELSKDRIYTVEQDREFDMTKHLIEDEEKMLDEKNMFGIYRNKGIPVLSSGLERKIKYAQITLDMLKYIHTREGNTEYDEEEKLINELNKKILNLKNAFAHQRDNIKRLNAALSAYKEFKSTVDVDTSTSLDNDIKNVLYKEYKDAKNSFLKQSNYIKASASDLFAYQSKIDQEKFKIDVREDKKSNVAPKEVSDVSNGFFDRVKKFFSNIIQKIKDTFRSVVQLFTSDGIKSGVDNVVSGMLGIDNSKGGQEGLKQWITEIVTMGNEIFKDEYMNLAKMRDEENRKKVVDEKGKNSVLLESRGIISNRNKDYVKRVEVRDSNKNVLNNKITAVNQEKKDRGLKGMTK